MKILSLFDGLSCAQIAINKLGYKNYIYYASEIDKYSIAVTQYNYSNTIQLGDITKLKGEQFKDIHLLIGGSPCQDLSIAKKNREGLEGSRSGLFWEYVRLLKEIKPKYFILENVNSMPKEAKEIISKALGIEPIMINASLVSAQNRKRLFWTNIENITQPKDRNLFLKNIINVKRNLKFEITKYIQNVKINTSAYRNSHKNIVNLTEKSKCLTASGQNKSNASCSNLYMEGKYYKLTPIECERLQTIPDDYTKIGNFGGKIREISNTQRYKMLGNSFCCDVIAHILSYIKEI